MESSEMNSGLEQIHHWLNRLWREEGKEVMESFSCLALSIWRDHDCDGRKDLVGGKSGSLMGHFLEIST